MNGAGGTLLFIVYAFPGRAVDITHLVQSSPSSACPALFISFLALVVPACKLLIYVHWLSDWIHRKCKIREGTALSLPAQSEPQCWIKEEQISLGPPCHLGGEHYCPHLTPTLLTGIQRSCEIKWFVQSHKLKRWRLVCLIHMYCMNTFGRLHLEWKQSQAEIQIVSGV